ncbi:MAG TPA: chorismate-binding protein [Acidimicrobiales bacterium]|nr:chorismate-binding protein [Acidimicrobiales bacterium]
MAEARARFDDLRSRRSTVLADPVGELRAQAPGDVVALLDEVQAAAARGWHAAGYLAYECAPAFDRALVVSGAPSASPAPLAWFGLFRGRRDGPLALPPVGRASAPRAWTLRDDAPTHARGVERILAGIARGDVYQVNLTTAALGSGVRDAPGLYRRLVEAQQPGYGALLEFDGVAVASASPELFFAWDGEEITSRPMKGTAARGRFAAEDEARRAALAGSAKDLAENVMIVDLVRNDLGRVARTGSVRVTSVSEVEGYPTVWQMVSEVRGATDGGVTLTDVFGALFPAGSVTGAPKTSAMRLVAELESAPRGIYCGAVGLVGPGSRGIDARFNVPIRTVVVGVDGGLAQFGTGGGIVAASDPDAEYRELVLKAAVLPSGPARAGRLLETFRHTPGRPGARALHLARLRASAALLGYVVPADLEAGVERRVASVREESRVRVLVSRNGSLSVEVDRAPEATVEPLRLAVDDVPVSSADPRLFHKTTDRRLYDDRRRRHPGVDDVVLVNERGECTESLTSNLAVRLAGEWLTPPLDSGCLPGVERARLVAEGRLVERVVTVAQLRAADGLAVVNSLRGWRPARLVDAGAAAG